MSLRVTRTLLYNPFESWPLSVSQRVDERTRTSDLISHWGAFCLFHKTVLGRCVLGEWPRSAHWKISFLFSVRKSHACLQSLKDYRQGQHGKVVMVRGELRAKHDADASIMA